MGQVELVIIGGGQAGLSAAYHLQRHGLQPWTAFVILDANRAPGGAWQHRWPSLTLDGVHGIHDLPGLAMDRPDPNEPASSAVERYFAAYEEAFGLPVRRPVRVTRVDGDGRDRLLRIQSATETWVSRLLINATGTWDTPYWPWYPGRDLFRGRQLHTHDFSSASEFTGQHVVVVGGGTSAVQFLLQLNRAGATTTWVTRRPPEFSDQPLDVEWGRDVERRVHTRTDAGLVPASVVSVTKLPLTSAYRRGIDDGTLVSAGPMTRITEDGIVLADGRHVRADAILWATGFRASLGHLAPLHLREPGGGIMTRSDGVRLVRDSRVLLVGYGASASTLGATRAGRTAALEALRLLGR